MKTISSCFLGIIILVVGTLLNAGCIIDNLVRGSWGWAIWDAVVVVIGVLLIRWLYLRAKEYELIILNAIKDLFMRQSIRDFKDFLESREDEINDTEDELEKH